MEYDKKKHKHIFIISRDVLLEILIRLIIIIELNLVYNWSIPIISLQPFFSNLEYNEKEIFLLTNHTV